MSMQRKSTRLYWGLLVTAIFLFVVFSASEGLAAKKKKYDSWKGVAADMALEFDSAREDIEADRTAACQPCQASMKSAGTAVHHRAW